MGVKDKLLNKKHDMSEYKIMPTFPKVMKLDICNSCNYRCMFCPQAKKDYTTGCIDKELAYKLIKDFYDGGGRELCLAMRGEPLLNSDMANYVRYAKEIGYTYVFTNTNGFLLSEDKSQELIEAGIDSVKLSINSHKELYKTIHGVDGYIKVLNNCIFFDKIRKESHRDIKLYVSFVAIKQTLQDVALVEKDFGDYVDEIMVMNANSRGGSISEVTSNMYAGDDEYTFEYPCSQLFNTINVTAEGYMIACCQDFDNLMVIEDINKKSVIDAWNGDVFCELRRKYMNGEIQNTLCVNCLSGSINRVVPLRADVLTYPINETKRRDLIKRIGIINDMYR